MRIRLEWTRKPEHGYVSKVQVQYDVQDMGLKVDTLNVNAELPALTMTSRGRPGTLQRARPC